MKIYQILITIPIVLMVYFLSTSFNNTTQKKWVAPASADKIVNPLKNDANAATSGKKLYMALCSVCHGIKGKGDGVAGAGLTPRPADLTSETCQAQTDGALFWKIETGRSPMPSYETSIAETKRWAIINYIRTLKK